MGMFKPREMRSARPKLNAKGAAKNGSKPGYLNRLIRIPRVPELSFKKRTASGTAMRTQLGTSVQDKVANRVALKTRHSHSS